MLHKTAPPVTQRQSYALRALRPQHCALENWKYMGLSTKVGESGRLPSAGHSWAIYLTFAEPRLPHLTTENDSRLLRAINKIIDTKHSVRCWRRVNCCCYITLCIHCYVIFLLWGAGDLRHSSNSAIPLYFLSAPQQVFTPAPLDQRFPNFLAPGTSAPRRI